MWKEYFKEDKVYVYELDPIYNGGIEKQELALLKDGFLPVFDRRNLSYQNGRAGSLILENGLDIQERVASFQKEIAYCNLKNHVIDQFKQFQPSNIPDIKKLLDEHRVKNIIIESHFKDILQLRHLIINLFSCYTELNLFISSDDKFIEVLNDELENNMLKYPVRNKPYNQHNDLTFALSKNNIYEIQFNSTVETMKVISFTDNKFVRLEYSSTLKFMNGDYKCDYSNVEEADKRYKWLT